MKNAQLLPARRHEQAMRHSQRLFTRDVRAYSADVLSVIPLDRYDFAAGVPLRHIATEASVTVGVVRACLCWLHTTDQARPTRRGSGLWRRYVKGVDVPAEQSTTADGQAHPNSKRYKGSTR